MANRITRQKVEKLGVGDNCSDFVKSGKEPMSDLVKQIYVALGKFKFNGSYHLLRLFL